MTINIRGNSHVPTTELVTTLFTKQGGGNFYERKQLLERNISRIERQIGLAREELDRLKRARDDLVSSMR
jgi:hypothetical protein